MAEYVVMPTADWQEVLDATREKTGQSDLLTSGEVGSQIRAIPSGDGGITPTGTKQITENGTYDVTGYASAEVNVEASGGGTAEDLSAELTEQDELLTAVEAALELIDASSATLTVNFAYEDEPYDEENGVELEVGELHSTTQYGYYTVDDGEPIYFEDAESLTISCSVGSTVVVGFEGGDMSPEYDTTAEVGCVGDFLCDSAHDGESNDHEGESGGCREGAKITVNEVTASVVVYECYS